MGMPPPSASNHEGRWVRQYPQLAVLHDPKWSTSWTKVPTRGAAHPAEVRIRAQWPQTCTKDEEEDVTRRGAQRAIRLEEHMIRLQLIGPPEEALLTGQGSHSQRGIAVSLLLHGAVLGLATLPGPVVAVPTRPKEIAPQYTQIILDDKLYYVTQLSPPSERPRGAAAPSQAARPSKEETHAGQLSAPKVPEAMIPPKTRRDPTRLDTLVQADLLTIRVTPDTAQLPSFQAWTGRLAPFRREFVVPGQRSAPHVQTVELEAPPDMRNPVLTSSLEIATAPKLPLRAALPVVDVTLPAVDLPTPARTTGDPINVISSTPRSVNMPDRLVIPPDNVVGLTGGEPSATATDPSTGTGTGKQPGTGADGGNGAPGTGTVRDASADRNAERAAGAKGATSDPLLITRSPQGRFDSIVVQSSPLDQFPSGNTLLHGRPIFTVYIPVGIGKDWAMYFCVQREGAVNTASDNQGKPLDPPYPYKLLRPKITVPGYQKYLLVHGFVTETGTVSDLRVIPPVKQDVADLVLAALNQWTFRPAVLQGVTVKVEFLLAIPAGTF